MRNSFFRKIFSNKKKGSFPGFVSKTDEERIQNMPWILQRESGTKFVATEKVDGQSATYFLVKNKNRFLWFGDKYVFGVCSRNLLLPKEDSSSWWTIAKRMNMKDVLLDLIQGDEFVAIQGEIIGTNIQANKYKVSDFDFFAFNLIRPDGRISSTAAKNVLSLYNIKFVPILDEEFVLPETMDQALKLADGKSVLHDTLREGLVIRNFEKNLSFKIVSNEFLLKNNE
jgi:RNA ligase (TIGR02306 family)